MATRRRKALNSEDVENKGLFYWYHDCLFSDEEFIAEAKQFRDYIITEHPTIASFDPDFLKDAGVSDKDIHRMFDIAKKWRTPPYMLKIYLDNNGREGLLLNPTLSGSRVERGLIILEMSSSVTNSQFIKMWPAVEAWKKQLTGKVNSRNRGPDNFPLLYYVHKAVKRGDSFQKISEAINKDELNGYKPSNGVKKFIYTPKEIEQFYNMYSDLLS